MTPKRHICASETYFAAFVMPSPLGSITPACISLRSALDMKNATMPKMQQNAQLRMLKTSSIVARCGMRYELPVAGAAPPPKSSPQKRQRVAAALIVSPHIGHFFVPAALGATARGGVRAGGSGEP